MATSDLQASRRRGPRFARRAAILLAGWTLVAALLAIQAWFSQAIRGEPVPLVRPLAIWLAWAYAWALLTPIALALAARFPLGRSEEGTEGAERAAPARAALVHLLAGGLLSALNLALFASVAPFVGAQSVGPTWLATFSRLLGTTFLLNLPAYGLLVGGAHAVRLARRVRERERRELRLEAELAEARLLALRAQLDPHFLFNTLNTISVLMREDVDAADRVLVTLSRLLRRALEGSGAAEVPLREELAFVEAYLEIEKARFADRLAYRVDVDPKLLEARVPSLLLQPLVENAVRHGLARRADFETPGRIEIAAEEREGSLRLTVRDNGAGLDGTETPGVGLANTRSRLRLLYGDRHSFAMTPGAEGGLVVTIAIPLRSAEARS